MKKICSIIFLLALGLPAIASAAYNSVSLTSSAVIIVGAYTLTISGSTAAVQSISVGASSFSVTLASGSSITVSSASLNQLSTDVQTDVVSNTCTASASSLALAYSGAGTVTNVVTPSATVCTDPVPAVSQAATASTVLRSGTRSSRNKIASPALTQVAISSPRVTALAATRALLKNSPFAKPLQSGQTNSTIKTIQAYMATDKAVYPEATVNGFYGPLTEKAVQRFQIKYGIITKKSLMVKSKGYGVIGPVTYAKIIEVYEKGR